MHAHLVFIILDHQGEEPDLDGTTDLEEPGTGRCLLLMAFNVGVMGLTVHSQAGPLTAREAVLGATIHSPQVAL